MSTSKNKQKILPRQKLHALPPSSSHTQSLCFLVYMDNVNFTWLNFLPHLLDPMGGNRPPADICSTHIHTSLGSFSMCNLSCYTTQLRLSVVRGTHQEIGRKPDKVYIIHVFEVMKVLPLPRLHPSVYLTVFKQYKASYQIS